MLEILLLLGLTRKIGEIVEGKGQKSGWFKFLAVILWFGGELMGGVLGLLIAGSADAMGFAYLFALMGAAAGAGLAYYIATQVKAAPSAVDERVFD